MWDLHSGTGHNRDGNTSPHSTLSKPWVRPCQEGHVNLTPSRNDWEDVVSRHLMLPLKPQTPKYFYFSPESCKTNLACGIFYE